MGSGECVGWGGSTLSRLVPLSGHPVGKLRVKCGGRGGACWWRFGGWKSQELHDLVLLLARKPAVRRNVSDGFVLFSEQPAAGRTGPGLEH
jgi:hypothetical protein